MQLTIKYIAKTFIFNIYNFDKSDAYADILTRVD